MVLAIEKDRKQKVKLLVIGLGGTIASDPERLTILGPDEIFERLDVNVPENTTIEFFDLMRIGSSQITHSEWMKLISVIYREYENHDAFIILHGTDTMAWTASALAFSLRNLRKPIILTGSMIPSVVKGSDAYTNISDAIRFMYKAIENSISGVYIVFNHKIILGVRASKINSVDADAFESINYPYIGYIRNNEVDINRLPRRFFEGDLLKVEGMFENKIMVLKVFPGIEEYLLDSAEILELRGLVVESYGLGNLPNKLAERLKSLAEKIPVLIISQPTYGGVNPSGYWLHHSFIKSGLIPACDMSKEAAIVKFMWILGRTTVVEEVTKLMMQNYEDEISPCIV